MNCITINNDDYELSFSEKLLEYNLIRSQYALYADEEADYLSKNFYSTYNTLDKLYTQGFSFMQEKINMYIKKAISSLIKMGITDIDYLSFRNDYYNEYNLVESVFDDFKSFYNNITETTNNLDAQRQIKKDSRGKFVGYGYGISGAVKSAVKAETLNLVTGLFYDIGNSIQKSNENKKIEKFKQEMFHSEGFAENVIDSFRMSILNIHFAIIDCINENLNKNILNYFEIGDLYNKSIAIFNNLIDNDISISSDDEISMLCKSIELYPFNSDVYEYIIRKYGDKNSFIEKFTDELGIKLGIIKKEILQEAFHSFEFNEKDLTGKKEKDEYLISEKKKYIDFALKLGISEDDVANDAYLCEINEQIIKISQEYRNVSGIQYLSDEEAELAREEENEIKKIFQDFKEEKINDEAYLNEKLNIINNRQFKSGVQKKHIELLEKRLKEIDIQFRTIYDILIDSREEACKTHALIDNFNQEKTALKKDLHSYKKFREKVKNNHELHEGIKKVIIGEIDSNISTLEFERKIRKAKNYNRLSGVLLLILTFMLLGSYNFFTNNTNIQITKNEFQIGVSVLFLTSFLSIILARKIAIFRSILVIISLYYFRTSLDIWWYVMAGVTLYLIGMIFVDINEGDIRPYNKSFLIMPIILISVILFLSYSTNNDISFLNISKKESNSQILKNETKNNLNDNTKAKKNLIDSEYIIPNSDSMFLSESDIEIIISQNGNNIIQYAINELFARHGLKFKGEKWINHFGKKSWYMAVEGRTDSEIQQNYFNDYERENLKLLLEIKKKYN